MTIVVYRDGVMATDSATSSDGIFIGTVTKVVRGSDGALAAAAGDGAYCNAFRDWFLEGRKSLPPKAEAGEFHALLVEADGSLFEVSHIGALVPLRAEFAATGAAWKFAYGALAAGASAEQTVCLCIEHCGSIRGPVQVERLGREPSA